MRPDDPTRISRMVEASDAIAQFVAGRRRPDLDSDRMLLLAVVRAIEIIDEAGSQVTNETRAATPEIPCRAMVGMRNRIVHAYWDIDTDIVGKTAVEETPALLAALRAALQRGTQHPR